MGEMYQKYMNCLTEKMQTTCTYINIIENIQRLPSYAYSMTAQTNKINLHQT